MCTEQSPQKRLPFAAVLSGHKGTIFPCEAAIILSLTTEKVLKFLMQTKCKNPRSRCFDFSFYLCIL